jgi:hypothetical protein
MQIAPVEATLQPDELRRRSAAIDRESARLKLQSAPAQNHAARCTGTLFPCAAEAQERGGVIVRCKIVPSGYTVTPRRRAFIPRGEWPSRAGAKLSRRKTQLSRRKTQ